MRAVALALTVLVLIAIVACFLPRRPVDASTSTHRAELLKERDHYDRDLDALMGWDRRTPARSGRPSATASSAPTRHP